MPTTTPTPTPKFVRSIQAAVRHWRQQSEHLDDETIRALDRQRQNLYQALEFGLKLPATQAETAVLVHDLNRLIEARGYYREWLPMLQQAIAVCGADAGAQRLRARLYRNLAFFYYRLGQHSRGIDVLQTAEAIAGALQDERLRAEIQLLRGEIHFYNHDYDEAEQHSRAALATFARLREEAPTWYATALNTLGKVAHNRGDYEQAESYLSEAVAIWRQQQDRPHRLARVLNDLAHVFIDAGRYAQARGALWEAQALLEGTAHEFDRVAVLIDLGLLYYRQEQWREAETTFRRANTDYLQQSADFYNKATVVNNLGNTLFKQGRLHEAEHHLQHAIDLWRRHGDKLSLANSLGTLGQVLAAQERADEALVHLEQALALLPQYADNAWARKLMEEFTEERDSLLPPVTGTSTQNE